MDTAYGDRLRVKSAEHGRFWKRLGGQPDFQNASILDVGSGEGDFCYHLAECGAVRVVGLDIVPQLVDTAKRHLNKYHSTIANKVEFYCGDISVMPDIKFDYIVSKNAFEHIDDVGDILQHMKERLKPGGRMYIGFGPLYRCINGAHMERFLIPWGHLYIPMPLYLKIAAYDRRHPMKSIQDFHLNMLRLRDFEHYFWASGLHIRYFKTNQSDSRVIQLFRILVKWPFMKDLFTSNLYCILEKASD